MAKRGKGAIRVEERQSRNDSAVNGSAWGPLREPIFRALWIASAASNVGSWMQDVDESWLMISLTKSPVLVALVETAVAGAAFLPKARQKVSNNLLVVGAGVLFAGMLAVLAHARVPAVAGAAMILRQAGGHSPDLRARAWLDC